MTNVFLRHSCCHSKSSWLRSTIKTVFWMLWCNDVVKTFIGLRAPHVQQAIHIFKEIFKYFLLICQNTIFLKIFPVRQIFRFVSFWLLHKATKIQYKIYGLSKFIYTITVWQYLIYWYLFSYPHQSPHLEWSPVTWNGIALRLFSKDCLSELPLTAYVKHFVRWFIAFGPRVGYFFSFLNSNNLLVKFFFVWLKSQCFSRFSSKAAFALKNKWIKTFYIKLYAKHKFQ